jgi:hypothetical protein
LLQEYVDRLIDEEKRKQVAAAPPKQE